jgi:hypothetical protein
MERRTILRYLSGLHQITGELIDLPNESYPAMVMANLPPDNRLAACKLLKTTPTYVLYAEVDGSDSASPPGTPDAPAGVTLPSEGLASDDSCSSDVSPSDHAD